MNFKNSDNICSSQFPLLNFKSLVQNSPDLIYCLDSNSKIIFINDSAKKYGYSANELIGKDILEIIHPEDHNIAQYRINERRTGERRTKSLELRLLDKNNLARDFDIKFTGLEHTFLSVDSEGVYDSNSETKFIGTQGIARDITKRVQAEEALRESENKYRMLTECTNNIVFSIDANGIINYIGPQIYRLGYKPSEIIAKSFLNFIHPDDRDHTQQDFVRTMSSGEEFISQFRIIDRSGNALWFEEYGRVQKDNDGRITGVIGVLHDITEQKGYEQALIKSEKQHRDFYNTALAGMFRISINTGKIIKANDKFLELFGFEDIESFNKTWKKDSSYYLRGRKEEFFDILERSGNVTDFEIDLKVSRNRIIHTALTAKMFKEKGYIEGVIIDNTERKKAEMALRESEEKFRLISEQSLLGITIIQDGKIRYANQEMADLIGVPYNEIKNWTVQDIAEHVHPEDRDFSLSQIMKKQIGEKDVVKHHSYRFMIPNGEIKWISIYSKTINYFGKPALLVAQIDINERMKQSEENKKLQVQLFHSQKMESIGRLAGGIAHDFNNILAGIRGYSELLKIRPEEAMNPAPEELEEIIRLTDRASDLTKDILGFARKDNPKTTAENFNDIVKESVKVAEKIFEKNVKMFYDLDKEPELIKVDRNQINQVLTNLLINAKDAMPDGGEITICTSKIKIDKEKSDVLSNLEKGKYVKLSITDTGKGMSRETVNNIFEPFFTTKSKNKGTGLGLAMVYSIIQNHKGQINVYSEPGHGTTFTIYLPAISCSIKTPKKESKSIKGNAFILLVDDERPILQTTKSLLEPLGYKMITAENGYDALEIFTECKEEIDLVLLDVILSGLDALQVFRKLKEIDPKIKVLLLSGYSKNSLIKKLIKEGADGFLQKPFTVSLLSEKVHETLNKK